MRALRFDGQQVIFDRQAPEPTLRPGDALIRPTLVGVDDTDVRVARGQTNFSGVLGHEFVGVVERVNIPDDAPRPLLRKRELAGRRVVGSASVVCGHCDLCRSGLSVHCRSRIVAGVSGRDGCFADLFTLPASNLAAVPEAMDDEHAVCAALVARAVHAARLIRVETQPFVTVLGDSELALLTAQVLAKKNATVRLIATREETSDLCSRWGIKHRSQSDVGRRQDQSAVVDCTGTASGLRLAMQMVRPRGMIILKSSVALMPFPPGVVLPDQVDESWSRAVDLTMAISNEIQILGSREAPMGDAISVIESGEVDMTGLVTKRLDLERGVEAIRLVAGGEELKVVLDARQQIRLTAMRKKIWNGFRPSMTPSLWRTLNTTRSGGRT